MFLYPEMPARWEGQIELADGHRRYCKRFGTEGGEPVLAIHDGPGADLRLCVPLASIAGRGTEVILYDQLGGGGSDRMPAEHHWRISDFVAEAEMLVSALQLGSVHLVGQCWGGALALELALRRPEMVRTLVVCNGMARTQTLRAGCEALLAPYPKEVREALDRGGEIDSETDVGDTVLGIFARHIRRCTPFEPERSRREFSEWIVPMLADLGPAYLALWGPNDFIPSGPMVDWDVTSRLAEIAAPALVVSGLHDAVSLDCGRELVEGLSDVRWQILGQSSHFPLLESESGTLTAAIRGFVLEHARDARSPPMSGSFS